MPAFFYNVKCYCLDSLLNQYCTFMFNVIKIALSYSIQDKKKGIVKMPITYSVNNHNTRTVLSAAMKAAAELELTDEVIAYKAANKIVKEYKDSARDIIIPTISMRVGKIILKSVSDLPKGFIQMPRSANTNKKPNASDGLNFMYMGMQGRFTSTAPKLDYSYRMKAAPIVKSTK